MVYLSHYFVLLLFCFSKLFLFLVFVFYFLRYSCFIAHFCWQPIVQHLRHIIPKPSDMFLIFWMLGSTYLWILFSFSCFSFLFFIYYLLRIFFRILTALLVSIFDCYGVIVRLDSLLYYNFDFYVLELCFS